MVKKKNLTLFRLSSGLPKIVGAFFFLIVIQIYNVGLYFKNLQINLQICKNFNIYCNYKLLSKKCAKKTRSARNMINYTFLKSHYHVRFKYTKIFAKF